MFAVKTVTLFVTEIGNLSTKFVVLAIWCTSMCSSSDVCYYFGCGSSGQLGIGHCLDWIASPQQVIFPSSAGVAPLVDSISAGSYHSTFVLNNGQIYTCGSSSGHRLGLLNLLTQDQVPTPSLIEDLEDIGFSFLTHLPCGVKFSSCGVWHTIAVLHDTNDLYGWGWSIFGQFGWFVLYLYLSHEPQL
jgi:alpha-tubulin suppressor-like RCC1 family protein